MVFETNFFLAQAQARVHHQAAHQVLDHLARQLGDVVIVAAHHHLDGKSNL